MSGGSARRTAARLAAVLVLAVAAGCEASPPLEEEASPLEEEGAGCALRIDTSFVSATKAPAEVPVDFASSSSCRIESSETAAVEITTEADVRRSDGGYRREYSRYGGGRYTGTSTRTERSGPIVRTTRTVSKSSTGVVCPVAGENLAERPLSALNATVSADAVVAVENGQRIGHACRPLRNPGEMEGKWCVVMRKRCSSLEDKLANCADAGAVGVFMVLEEGEGGSDVRVRVPADVDGEFPVVLLDHAFAMDVLLPLLEADLGDGGSRVFSVGPGIGRGCS